VRPAAAGGAPRPPPRGRAARGRQTRGLLKYEKQIQAPRNRAPADINQVTLVRAGASIWRTSALKELHQLAPPGWRAATLV
jgi:hypothetical protein